MIFGVPRFALIALSLTAAIAVILGASGEEPASALRVEVPTKESAKCPAEVRAVGRRAPVPGGRADLRISWSTRERQAEATLTGDIGERRLVATMPAP
jgi:hypothetical protein